MSKIDYTKPLMFIDTVSKNNVYKPKQTTYDSRYRSGLSADEFKKLENICFLYKKNMPIVCSIQTLNKIYEGIVKEIINNQLVVISQGKTEYINILDITKFMVLEI